MNFKILSLFIIIFLTLSNSIFAEILIDNRTPLTQEQIELNQQILKARAKEEIKKLEIKKQIEKIILENEKFRTEIENIKNKNRLELIQLKDNLEKLSLKNQYDSEKLNETLNKFIEKKEKLQKELDYLNVKKEKELEILKNKQREILLKNSLKNETNKNLLSELKLKNDMLSLEIEKLKKQLDKDNLYELKKINKLKSDMEYYNTKSTWDKKIYKKITERTNPFINKVLYVNNRRIDLNGPIISGTADYVCDRVHYFNNKSSKLPIFIVIDYCPGGSVMEGARILKAMESSSASIHVVVKSMAASMAAIILTRAEHSYAFPNAIILHHQPLTSNDGNITQHREQLEFLKKWGERMLKPIAKKMGISLEKFYKEMYKNNSTGDWSEFADDAVKLKWVNNIIKEIKEEGQMEYPAAQTMFSKWFYYKNSEEQEKNIGEKNKIKLPHLQPFDFYFIYDPNKNFTWN